MIETSYNNLLFLSGFATCLLSVFKLLLVLISIMCFAATGGIEPQTLKVPPVRLLPF